MLINTLLHVFIGITIENFNVFVSNYTFIFISYYIILHYFTNNSIVTNKLTAVKQNVV
jgi:hypothetical protein